MKCSKPELPPCSEWGIWEGPEIEGKTELREKTLFVRRGDWFPYAKNYSRIWFCKEYTDWFKIRAATQVFSSVCLEVNLATISSVPDDIRAHVQLYLKIEANLKENDHICVGTRFADEAFLIGTGNRVAPSDYSTDILLER